MLPSIDSLGCLKAVAEYEYWWTSSTLTGYILPSFGKRYRSSHYLISKFHWKVCTYGIWMNNIMKPQRNKMVYETIWWHVVLYRSLFITGKKQRQEDDADAVVYPPWGLIAPPWKKLNENKIMKKVTWAPHRLGTFWHAPSTRQSNPRYTAVQMHIYYKQWHSVLGVSFKFKL